GAVRDGGHLGCGGCPRRRRCCRVRRAGAGGAAVAGLRLLRPVQGFRAAGRRVPFTRGQAAAGIRENEIGMINRADNSGFANWWFTVDRVALGCMLALAGIGLMLAFAASPAITGGPLSG